MIDRLQSCPVILHFDNEYKVWMLSNDDVLIISSLGDCFITQTRWYTSPFTSSNSNSIVQMLTFGDVDSPFLNAGFKTVTM